MTKLRSPVTQELALTRIAGTIGWDKVAELAGKGERAVRNWADPDTAPSAEDAIPIGLARRLDAAYHAAGGDGFPLLHCMALQLETDVSLATADALEIARCAALAAIEGGEAIAAAIEASRPGATPAVIARAELETEEAVTAHANVAISLRKMRGAARAEPVPQ